MAAACVLRAVYYPAPSLLPRSPAIRNKKTRHLVFFLFVSLAQTTSAQPARGTSPSVGLLVLLMLLVYSTSNVFAGRNDGEVEKLHTKNHSLCNGAR